jgi:hypothetical protein
VLVCAVVSPVLVGTHRTEGLLYGEVRVIHHLAGVPFAPLKTLAIGIRNQIRLSLKSQYLLAHVFFL